MKPGTEGLASPDSNMVAPQEKDRKNDWIQVESKKNRRLAKKKSNSQVTKFKPSCKHHASPDSLINIDTCSNDDSASYTDVLLGKKKPTKQVCKRTLNLTPKKGKKDTIVTRTKMKTTSVYPPLILQTRMKNIPTLKTKTTLFYPIENHLDSQKPRSLV